jgi:hypothetical protein
MKLKLWIGGYLAVAAIAAIGVWLDCFTYPLMIVIGLIAWVAPDIGNLERLLKGQSK